LLGPGNCTQLIFLPKESQRRCSPKQTSGLCVSELPTGTVTLLLADVEDSTGLWETQPEEMTDAIARLEAMLCDLVAAHSGVRPVEQGEGGSVVVAFARASDAVACALELQRAPGSDPLAHRTAHRRSATAR
jgi:class 3 adenylate cyclase